MRKKTSEPKAGKVKKWERAVFRLLILSGVLMMIGLLFVMTNHLALTELYTSFVLNFIGMSFLLASVLALCSFFLYLFVVIVFVNPQRIKKTSIAKFAIGGILTLIVTILIVIFSVNEAGKSIRDMSSYSNGEWQVKELVVTDIYRGYGRRSLSGRVLIETLAGEMILYHEDFHIVKGEAYRFTYLGETNTIIKIEEIAN